MRTRSFAGATTAGRAAWRADPAAIAPIAPAPNTQMADARRGSPAAPLPLPGAPGHHCEGRRSGRELDERR